MSDPSLGKLASNSEIVMVLRNNNIQSWQSHLLLLCLLIACLYHCYVLDLIASSRSNGIMGQRPCLVWALRGFLHLMQYLVYAQKHYVKVKAEQASIYLVQKSWLQPCNLDETWSKFGTFMSISWPDEAKETKNSVSHQLTTIVW